MQIPEHEIRYIEEVLINAQNPDPNIQKPAEEKLFELERDKGFLVILSVILAGEEYNEQSRSLAALFLKNQFTRGHDQYVDARLAQTWLELDDIYRRYIKENGFIALMSEFEQVRRTAATLIGAIAWIEYPKNLWNEVFNDLIQLHQKFPTNVVLKGVLTTIGFICENLNDSEHIEQIHLIYEFILAALDIGILDEEVLTVAIRSLYNSFEYISLIFSDREQRSRTMQSIGNALISPFPIPKSIALECLSKIAYFYYEILGEFIEKTVQITIEAMNHADTKVVIQAISFWTTVAEVEHELINEFNDGIMTVPNQGFIKIYANSIILPICSKLIRVEEWIRDVPEQAAIAIQEISHCIPNQIFEETKVFLNETLFTECDWSLKDAGILCLTSIIEGGNPIHLSEAIDFLFTNKIIESFLIPNNFPDILRESTTYLLSKILNKHLGYISSELFDTILGYVKELIKDPVVEVAINAAWSYNSFARAHDIEHPDILPYLRVNFFDIMKNLFLIAWQIETPPDLRFQSLAAINSMIRAAPSANSQDIIQLFHEMKAKLIEISKLIPNNREELSNKVAIQSHILDALQIICIKVGKEVTSEIYDLMDILLFILNDETSDVNEQAISVIQPIIHILNTEFSQYINKVHLHYIEILRFNKETRFLTITLNSVGDMFRLAGNFITPDIFNIYIEELSNLFYKAMNKEIELDVFTPIIAVHTDITLAIGANIQSYIVYIHTIVDQVIEMGRTPTENRKHLILLDNMRMSAAEVVSAIIQAYKSIESEQKLIAINEIWNRITGLIISVGEVPPDRRSDQLLNAVVGLIGKIFFFLNTGDTADCLSNTSIYREGLNELNSFPQTSLLVREAYEHQNPDTKKIGNWATRLLRIN